MKIGINIHSEFYLVIRSSSNRIKYFVILVVFMLGFTIKSYSKNFYFSSSTGNDSYTAIQAQEPNTPWRTIDQLNRSMNLFTAGDYILFNRGDTFYGNIKISKSGTAGSPITIGAYGTGEKPIIKGFTTVSSWTKLGSNIWESTSAVSTLSTCNMVSINGVNTAMGRYPNTGYLTFQSHSGTNSITSSSLSGSPDWTGAELVVRSGSALDRTFITAQSGGTLTYSPALSEEPKNGYGFFIQNDSRTIDQQNEWYYNPTTKKIRVYSISSPSNVQVASVDVLVTCRGSYITFDNISFTGANSNAFNNFWENISDFNIQNCSINFSGIDAIHFSSASNFTIEKNTILHSNNNGINLSYDNYATIRDNVIQNAGILPGMGQKDWGTYNGIIVLGSNTIIENNQILNVGYSGINFNNISALIKNNLVDTFCTILYDGGGIYTGLAGVSPYDTKIIGNIILNGIGAAEGTNDSRLHANGIYLDDGANIEVSNNSVANCGEKGIFMHNAHDNNVHDNTVYNCLKQIGFQADNENIQIRNNIISNNIFVSKSSIQVSLYYSHKVYFPIANLGSADNNYYARPIDDSLTIQTFVNPTYTNYTLAEWQTYSGLDTHSHKSNVTVTDTADIVFCYNATAVATTTNLSTPMIDVKGTKYVNSITLLPFTSVVLMVDPNPDQPVIPVYTGSGIEIATPSLLVMTYNVSLANIVPAASALTVQVNSVTRSVNTVAISGTKVLLTLASPVVYGDVITVAYTKPSANPLQTAAGGQAATISAQAVTNNVSPAIPVYQSSAIENTAPSVIEMTYNLTLAYIVPASSTFSVMVSSESRTVSAVTISGTKVLLTLSSPVVYGDVITVAYTKPSANPLQTAAGGQAATISAQAVTNNVSPAIPVYQSSAIENDAPSVIEMTYNLPLSNIVPASSAFSVMVNSVAKTVSSVTISGTKVLLTLSSPIFQGDVVTVSYNKPLVNPLQTSSGGQVVSLSVQTVTNNVATINTPPIVVVNYLSSSYSGFVNEINASGSYDLNKDNLIYTWVVPNNMPVSSTTISNIKYLSPIVNAPVTVEFKLIISDGKTIQSKVIPIEILPYKSELEVAEVSNIEASSFESPYYPYNIIDGNIGTMWSANGDNQWLIIDLKHSFDVQHVKLAFQPGQKREQYFDIYGSLDKVNWESILIKSSSCAFSGDIQVFDFPPSKTGKEFNYVKLVGRCNSTDSWNYISEFKIFGNKHLDPSSYEEQPVKIYPNPAHEYINISIDEPALEPDFIRIINLSGKVVFQDKVNPDIKNFQIPIKLIQGVYIVQMESGDLTLFTQKLIVDK